MLTRFYFHLRQHGLKPGLGEFLNLLDALKRGLAERSVAQFHTLARLILVKDESQYDRFDRAFGSFFEGAQDLAQALGGDIPEDWLKAQALLNLSDEDKAKLQALDWQALMDTLKQRLQEQQERHQGGNRWIGTGGTSPFGNSGYNPAGVRIGGKSMNRSAVKVWEQRNYRNLDDSVELSSRNIKLALRLLRRFARTGAADELDLDGTISATARNAGWLDLKLRPQRHNAIKVLIFFDIGGSMDDHVRVCEELFAAVRGEFKHLEQFYLHNFLYEKVWRDNNRRTREFTPTWEVLHKYPADYRVIIVGDASMSPYEITQPGGSVEHYNEEAGAVWLKRLTDVYSRVAWLNPVPRERWDYVHSVQITRELLGDRMYPLTLAGLSQAMNALAH
jgi:uncharacterized protein with von Willebrand factor type A (vWA) domain